MYMCFQSINNSWTHLFILFFNDDFLIRSGRETLCKVENQEIVRGKVVRGKIAQGKSANGHGQGQVPVAKHLNRDDEQRLDPAAILLLQ